MPRLVLIEWPVGEAEPIVLATATSLEGMANRLDDLITEADAPLDIIRMDPANPQQGPRGVAVPWQDGGAWTDPDLDDEDDTSLHVGD